MGGIVDSHHPLKSDPTINSSGAEVLNSVTGVPTVTAQHVYPPSGSGKFFSGDSSRVPAVTDFSHTGFSTSSFRVPGFYKPGTASFGAISSGD